MTIDQLPALTNNNEEVEFPVSLNGVDYKLSQTPPIFFPASGSINPVVTVTNGTRFALFVIGAGTSKGMYLYNCASNGAMTKTTAADGGGITLTDATRSVTITPSAACTCMIIVFSGKVTIS